MLANLEAWRTAQSSELDWHLKNQWRADDALFRSDTVDYFRRMGFKPNDYKSVIDAGCGPRLRSVYFNAKIYAIDPLAEQYKKHLPWCDLDKATVYPMPLEDYIPGLKAEFLFSLNCLDHCQDFDKVIRNISDYANTFFLSYDCGDPDHDALHPLELNEWVSEAVFAKYGLKIMKVSKTEPWRAGYALNYWLSK